MGRPVEKNKNSVILDLWNRMAQHLTLRFFDWGSQVINPPRQLEMRWK